MRNLSKVESIKSIVKDETLPGTDRQSNEEIRGTFTRNVG